MKEKGRGEVKRCRLLGRGRKRPADRRAGSDKVQHGLASDAQGSRCESGARARETGCSGSRCQQVRSRQRAAAASSVGNPSGGSGPALGGRPQAGVASSKTNRIAASAPGAPPLWRLVGQQCGGKQKEALTSIALLRCGMLKVW